MSEPSPKDRFITVYGFRPVRAALQDPALRLDKLVIAEGEKGATVRELEQAALARDVRVVRVSRHQLSLLSGSPRHDNGVLLDVVAPRMRPLADALAERPFRRPATVLILDGIRTPSNVGMIIRTAVAAGLGGIVVPHRGVAELDPLVVKASAGVAFQAPLLRCASAEDGVRQLVEAGYLIGAASADGDSSLFDAELATPLALVLGSETEGISAEVAGYVAQRISIPMPGGVESLNVAGAAAVFCFELVRRNMT